MMSLDPTDWTTIAGMLAAGHWWETWSTELWTNIRKPLFWFGIAAQSVFFLRFLVQWIVSERQGESTIPIAFWYLSLVGTALIFVYAILRVDPVFMLASVLQCVIYVRNLMLIGRQRRRLQAMTTPPG